MKPTEFLREWSAKDRELALALTIYEETTSAHGNPIEDVYDDNSDGWFEVKPLIDYEQQAIELWQKNNPKPDPGTVLRVVDTRNEQAD